MGNCLMRCFGAVDTERRPNKYFIGRYNSSNVDIEFENLIEDDEVQQTQEILTEEERNHLKNNRYADLVAEQQKMDAKIDEQLQEQENSARLEEEAYNAARQEAARAAQQARELERQKLEGNKGRSNGSAKSWLGSDANDWEIATEDDFETFLETVKAKSESVRASVTTRISQYVRTNRDSLPEQQAQQDDDSDVEWETDFVSSESTPEPIQVPFAPRASSLSTSSPSHSPHSKHVPSSSNAAVMASHNEPTRTGLPSEARTISHKLANGRLSTKQKDKMAPVSSAKTSSELTSTLKSKVNKDAPSVVIPKKTLDIDIDKFLEELDFDT